MDSYHLLLLGSLRPFDLYTMENYHFFSDKEKRMTTIHVLHFVQKEFAFHENGINDVFERIRCK